MIAQASWALQAALHARLASAPTLMGVALTDGQDENAPLPSLWVGEDVASDWSTKTTAGSEHRVPLLLWAPGPGFRLAKSVLASAQAAVAALPLAPSGGFTLVSLVPLGTRFTRDPTGRRVLGVLEWRARMLHP